MSDSADEAPVEEALQEVSANTVRETVLDVETGRSGTDAGKAVAQVGQDASVAPGKAPKKRNYTQTPARIASLQKANEARRRKQEERKRQQQEPDKASTSVSAAVLPDDSEERFARRVLTVIDGYLKNRQTEQAPSSAAPAKASKSKAQPKSLPTVDEEDETEEEEVEKPPPPASVKTIKPPPTSKAKPVKPAVIADAADPRINNMYRMIFRQ